MTRTASKLPWVGPRVAFRLHRMGLGVVTTTWDQLADLVQCERPETLAVDVFDTCLVRDLVGDDAVEESIDRVGASAGRDGHEEDSSPTKRVRADLAADVEKLLCRPVPDVARSLARVRAHGVAIVFLSDTERSSSTLRAILEEAGIFVEGDRLVASCEAGATKSDGDLFTKMWPADSGQAGQVWHVGDNLWSDVARAQQAGLRAMTIRAAVPTRYETAMAARPSTAGPAVAAGARKARLAIAAAAGDVPSIDTELETLGAQVAGQSFGSFLIWTAQQVRTERISQVWFLARDGELLYDMARAVPADHWGDATLGYLHCSRWSWYLAGAASAGLEAWQEAGTRDETSFIHANRHRVPLRSLLGRIGLHSSDLSGHPELGRLPAAKPLPATMAAQWDALLSDPAIGDVIKVRAEERRSLIIGYLQGLGFPDGPVGLVDVGWRGGLASVMSPIIREVTGHEPVHFHFGGDKVLADAEATVDIRRFAFDGVSSPFPVTNPVSCVETFTASGRARVVGYDRADDGTVVPVLEREVSEINNLQHHRLWDGAVRTARHLPSLALLEELQCDTDSLGPDANRVLALWWTDPSGAEPEALRGLGFEADDDGQSIQPLVQPYSAMEIALNRKRSRSWQQGSAALSPWFIVVMLRVYRMLQRHRDSWARTRRRRLPRLYEAAIESDYAIGKHEESKAEARTHVLVRLARMSLGAAVTVTGVVLIPRSGPGWLIAAGGLAILAKDIAWADRMLRLAHRRVPRLPADAAIPRSSIVTMLIAGSALAAASLWWKLS